MDAGISSTNGFWRCRSIPSADTIRNYRQECNLFLPFSGRSRPLSRRSNFTLSIRCGTPPDKTGGGMCIRRKPLTGKAAFRIFAHAKKQSDRRSRVLRGRCGSRVRASGDQTWFTSLKRKGCIMRGIASGRPAKPEASCFRLRSDAPTTVAPFAAPTGTSAFGSKRSGSF